MFYVTMNLEEQGTNIELSKGKFTKDKIYPVINVSNNPAYGVQFLIPDDNGELRYYKYEVVRYSDRIPGVKKEKE